MNKCLCHWQAEMSVWKGKIYDRKVNKIKLKSISLNITWKYQCEHMMNFILKRGEGQDLKDSLPCPLKRPTNNDQLSIKSTLVLRLWCLNIIFYYMKPGLLGQMTNSRSGARHSQINLKYLVASESKKHCQDHF